MFKKTLTILVLIAVIGIGIFVYLLVSDFEATDQKANTENNDIEKIMVKAENMPTEYEFRSDLHKMSHQKVDSDEKWGHLQITEERIDYMLEVLDRTDYNMEEMYRDFLTDWDRGIFNNAVEVHNTIWRLQDGSVGRATRLLSPAEEQVYIQEHFD